MKVKKIEGILLGFSLGLLLLGVGLFFLIPVVVKEGFAYSAPSTFLLALKSLVSFDFHSISFIATFVFICLVVVFEIVWIVAICVRKQPRHVLPAVVVLIAAVLIDIIIAAYFVAQPEFNGVTGKLFSAVLKSTRRLGKVLTFGVMGLIFASVISLALFAIVDLVVVLSAKEKAEEVAESKEEAAEVAQEIAKEEIPEQPVAQENPLEGLEERKAREEAFFNSCLATGDFEEFDEVELKDPIECEEEEPVFEMTEVEEENELIRQQNFVTIKTQRRVVTK